VVLLLGFAGSRRQPRLSATGTLPDAPQPPGRSGSCLLREKNLVTFVVDERESFPTDTVLSSLVWRLQVEPR
jgi:hypothetical protein